MSSQSVTLAQIAKRAGVHVSTVSRALSSDGAGVSSATATRIRAIADEMGYQPDPAGASLRTGRTLVLGILVPRVTDYVLARIFEGADEGAQRLGYTTVVANTNDEPALRMARLEKLLGRRVDGLLVGDARLDGDEVVLALKRRGTPYVLVNRRLSGHPSVTTDDIRGGELAAEHLLERGHTKVGVIAGLAYASTCTERTHGFVHTFTSAGIKVSPSQVSYGRADAEGGYEAASQLFEAHPDLTALFAVNDFAAIGAMGRARELGRAVPTDTAIVGYNDIPLARYLSVPLTTVRSPMVEMGRVGAELLVEQISGGAADSRLLEPALSVRESSTGER
jgi:LacI family transcriptional regulator